MRINRTKWNIINTVLNRISRELGVSIYEANSCFNDNMQKPVEFGLNWSACGTQSIEETQQYITKMNEAVGIAKFMNQFELTVDWSSEIAIDDSNKDFWLAEMERVYKAVKLVDRTYVVDFIERIQ